ncbi:ABC transporter ATP-binding protein [Pseudenhygromyxa sp. WMMC2535]|uniref:ABC transporter ATP-binding protein n=1 Tax=Pseudenhygromyxa sp. WMMC2535 TaxID=2712867 RepID=UPI00155631A3|nr:ABC transporter ATP-binding protein [Pseudenhygromyxa sp. WMMC2535]NVB41766.1 ABC transporter ATP-binding protein [Pseudenhygromyxa sp. WMMC2535]
MIEVEQLTFTYPGAQGPAVHDVQFTVQSGEIFGFLGPSGAGKSTVQKIMTRLLPLQSGEVRYDGRSLRTLDRDFFAEVGVSFEHPNLFPRLTGRENLEAFLGLYPARDGGHEDPLAVLERLGLGQAADKKAEDYSKGMKQRLVFARSLLHRPAYLFLDEPTSGLDPATARVVMAIIREHKERGAAILLTSHDMLVVDGLCDHLAFLHDGTIAACDTPRALKLRHGERSVRVEHRQNGVLTSETLFLDDAEDRRYLGSLTASGEIETMHSQEATLDTIFVKLTGRELAA